MNEFKIINNYFKTLSKKNPSAKNLNDDVFFDKKKGVVISIDTYNSGVHFVGFKYPYYIMKKIIRSSLSDLICKGVKPKYYFLSGGGNKKIFTKKNLSLISKSLKEEQKKYSIEIGGGDTVFSKIPSFSVTVIGFAKNIIERNMAKKNDDIYVTGNIGDSFLGLKVMQGKYTMQSKLKNYFINKYYCHDIPYNFSKYLKNFANTSIDISDGLISDMSRLINSQKLSFYIDVDKIPISKRLNNYIKRYKKSKSKLVFYGDDYQILFTSSKRNRERIKTIAKKMNQKVTIIGKITDSNKKNLLKLGNKSLKLMDFKGYSHKF
ncbi:MAG: thiamine-phosphate kinase [Candidatus Pelagibacter sp.]